ncbi:hypothetical protein, partial [Shewanella chilikensis]|uniref:hypothetical protein n=1 Tax=Shewanella chilikensis TaxID=558541 RepID=UPI00399955BF
RWILPPLTGSLFEYDYGIAKIWTRRVTAYAFGDFFFFREAKQAFGSFRFHGPTINVELPTIRSDFNADWYK